ncbi:MAG: SNF2-related protein [Bacilli bacterium]|nr:SNF2-related protein [Bacilli bacterium]
MFLTKAGSIGKALCASYLESATVRVIFESLKKGEYVISYYFDSSNEFLVYEAFSKETDPRKAKYIYLEVRGDGKPNERRGKLSALEGLNAEQKALYAFLYEKENASSKDELKNLNEIYKPVFEDLKNILPLSDAQVEKRNKMRKTFLNYIEVEEVVPEGKDDPIIVGKMRAVVSLFQTIRDNEFDMAITLIDEDGKAYKIDNLSSFLNAFINEEPYRLKKHQIRINENSFDPISLSVIKYVAGLSGLTTSLVRNSLNVTQVAKLLTILSGQSVMFGSDKYYVDSEIHPAGYKVLPSEELEFVPPLSAVSSFRSHSNSEYILILDPKNKVVEVYKFANPAMGKVFNFFMNNPDVDFDAIKDIIFEKIPLEMSLNALTPKEENNLHIAIYVDMNEEGHITFKTIYMVFGEVKSRNDIEDNYYYKATLAKYDRELAKVGAFENGVIKEQEKILSFLQKDLTDLKEVADVMLSDQLSNAKVRRPEGLSIAIKNEIDWLSLSINSKEFSAQEVSEILDSYRKKKKFVLLRGDYILLKEEDLQVALEIKQSTKMNGSLKSDSRPIYEAFKLMALGEEGANVEFNDFVRGIINDISSFKDAKIKLPKEVKRIVRPYQEAGIKWLSVLHKYHLGGILADDMGLGKTLETISFLSGIKENKPCLIVAPKSVIYNWQSEFLKWSPDSIVKVIDGSKDERVRAISGIKNDEKSFYITSYDSLRNDFVNYKNVFFEVIVTDEAQYIKNGMALKSQAVREINAVSRFALTGTPIENSMADLWAIFDFLMPGYLDSFSMFKQRYIIAGDQVKARASLARKITPFLLRRTKSEVLRDLPKKTVDITTITMNDEARRYYDACLADVKIKIKEKEESILKGDRYSGREVFSVLPLLTKLREVCVDPSCFIDGFSEESAKISYALSFILAAIEAGHKILVFSSFTKVLDHLSFLLMQNETKSYYIFGGTPASERISMAEDFNNSDDVSVMLVSLKAGGTGLNLHGADIVLHLDPWWNVAAEEQATDRAYRIGQKRPVSVVKLICHDSIEEKVVKLQESKKELYDQIIKSGDEAISKLNFEDIKFLLG